MKIKSHPAHPRMFYLSFNMLEDIKHLKASSMMNSQKALEAQLTSPTSNKC